MKLTTKTARDFINPLLSRKSIDVALFNQFKQHLKIYKNSLAAQLATNQNEPNIVTNALLPFFKGIEHNAQPYSQKGQISIDLTIMQNTTPAVIIEAKKPNSNEMMTENNVNKKSFRQAVLYYMNEMAGNNKALFHIIITDFNSFYVFDAKDFERLFWRSNSIKKIYNNYLDKSVQGDRTEDFYADLEKELPNLIEEIQCAYFNVQLDYGKKELTAICKLLSADGLLKKFKANEANRLNENFYNELLYILGLEEAKVGGKKVIGSAVTQQAGTLYQNIVNKLGHHGNPNDFESVIKLIIIWVNRILFLKLLESQIVKWTEVNSPDSKNNKFLSHENIKQYDQLETLFFEVLAKPAHARNSKVYDAIPYLNSSLFETHADEKSGMKISSLEDDLEINYYAKTVVKDTNNQSKTGKVSTLPYLLEFLDAYNFANDSKDEVTNNAKSLISASVLGLIFEKINGYKDGSFYTPSFITMYMARETITKAVIDKFNANYGWQCKNLVELHNSIKDIPHANTLINSITICDPAVGSGHFLVSALNEMLFIKAEIGVLVDAAGRKLTGYSFSIESDELIIKDDQGNIFEYKKSSDTKTRLQKTLFKEKQIIIENCLFGVDINPNSVNICRLRLWIELLKNAYYKPDGQLDTLPNIDINIKCGNSLISRFGLADDIKSTTIKAEIQDYKTQVMLYKENIGSKQQVLQAIDNVKVKFKADLKDSHVSTRKLNDALVLYVSKYSIDGLTSHQKLKVIDDLKLSIAKQDNLFGHAVDLVDKAKYKKLVDAAWSAVEEIESGKIYQNAFEWRFEFPEVLNADGDFVGFDVVIGNPPYMIVFNESQKHFLENRFLEFKRNNDLYVAFIIQAVALLKSNGLLSLITPNTYIKGSYYLQLRQFLAQKIQLTEVIDFGNTMIFDDASVFCAISSAIKVAPKLGWLLKSDMETLKGIIPACDEEFLIKNDVIQNLNQFSKFGEFFEIKDVGFNYWTVGRGKVRGQSIGSRVLYKGERENELDIPYVKGVDITKFGLSFSNNYLKHNWESMLAENDTFRFSNSFFQKSPKILYRQTSNKIIATIDIAKQSCDKTVHIIVNKIENTFDLKYALAILNSKLIDYYFNSYKGEAGRAFAQVKTIDVKNLPFINANIETQQPFINKVNAIFTAKQNNQDTRQLEQALDAMVYALYSLTDDEIKVIEAANT